MSPFPKLCIIVRIINKPDHTSWAGLIPVLSYFMWYPCRIWCKEAEVGCGTPVFTDTAGRGGKGWWEAEGEVMSSPAFLQLFSRYINMKQAADLRIDGRGGAENGGKDTKGDQRESAGFDLIGDQCCRNDWLLLRWLNSKGLWGNRLNKVVTVNTTAPYLHLHPCLVLLPCYNYTRWDKSASLS